MKKGVPTALPFYDFKKPVTIIYKCCAINYINRHNNPKYT